MARRLGLDNRATASTLRLRLLTSTSWRPDRRIAPLRSNSRSWPRAALCAVAIAWWHWQRMTEQPCGRLGRVSTHAPCWQMGLRWTLTSWLRIYRWFLHRYTVNPDFERSVLGCIEADSYNQTYTYQRRILQYFSSFTRLARFCTAPSQQIQIFASFRKRSGLHFRCPELNLLTLWCFSLFHFRFEK